MTIFVPQGFIKDGFPSPLGDEVLKPVLRLLICMLTILSMFPSPLGDEVLKPLLTSAIKSDYGYCPLYRYIPLVS